MFSLSLIISYVNISNTMTEKVFMEYIISKEYDNICLRSYLRSVLNVSRAELTSLKKKEDGIVLNGKKTTVRAI